MSEVATQTGQAQVGAANIEAATHVGAKLYLKKESFGFDPETCIGVFQRWIQEKSLEDEVMIDVADYRHLDEAPQVMLICHAAHYAFDTSDGTPGIYFDAKRDEPKALSERITRAVRKTLVLAKQLSETPECKGLAFDTTRIQIRIQDRLNAPNTKETLEAITVHLDKLGSALYPNTEVAQTLGDTDKNACFAVTLQANNATGISLDDLCCLWRV